MPPRQPVVLISDALSPATVAALGDGFDVRHCDGTDRAGLLAAVADADALMVLGSSLTVMSGLRFVRRAAKASIPIVIVNRGATRGDQFASAISHDGCSETLTALVDALPSIHRE